VTVNAPISLPTAATFSVAIGKTITLGGGVNAVSPGTAFGLGGTGSHQFDSAIGSNIGNVLFDNPASAPLGNTASATFT
jgi:hypothetical protein